MAHRDGPGMAKTAAGDARSLATDLLVLAGLDQRLLDRVQFTGPSTVLPSSYRVTDASQSLVAALCAAVAGVGEMRSAGKFEAGSITVDATESAAAFQSERHLMQPQEAALWDDLSGHYATADGHIQFHTNFAHHREALLTATGNGQRAGRAEVAAVVARSERFELEEVVADAGGIAAALRSPEEWLDHPHCSHIAGRPPLQIARRDGSSEVAPDRSLRAPVGAAAAKRPLAGLRVLDCTRVIAGPVCTRTLAAYGADVLRIGAPGLPVVDSILPDTTLGKRFADCDITTPTGRATVIELATDADVVVTGYRPGALAGHGVGTDDLFGANPNLVLATLSAFGPDGPWGGKRGFDSITQTATGIVATEMRAYDSVKPRSLPCQLLDHGSGFLLALGVLGALAAQHELGGGHLVDTSLLTTRNWLESLGPADPKQGRKLTEADVGPFMQTRDATSGSKYGAIAHVRQPGTIEGIVARWDRGPTKPGTDQAVWLPRN